MTIEAVKEVLFWCGIINMGLLFWWLLFFVLFHEWMYRMHTYWFDMSVQRFDAIHYCGMVLYKMIMITFNWVPYFALMIMI
ncbi:MAG: hypothetical protein OEW63_03730 [Gammaproteobacteria bacterium]|nr:hypothetical protein [Gammaproteobacteria bacterium]